MRTHTHACTRACTLACTHAPHTQPTTHTHTAEFSPFYGIDKGAVLQEARCFNDPQIDARKCQQVCVACVPACLLAPLIIIITHMLATQQEGIRVVYASVCVCVCCQHQLPQGKRTRASPVSAACTPPPPLLRKSLTLTAHLLMQVITKLLYLLGQGETFTKVRERA